MLYHSIIMAVTGWFSGVCSLPPCSSMDQTQGDKLGSKAILLTNNSFYKVIVLFCFVSPFFFSPKTKEERRGR